MIKMELYKQLATDTLIGLEHMGINVAQLQQFLE